MPCQIQGIHRCLLSLYAYSRSSAYRGSQVGEARFFLGKSMLAVSNHLFVH